MGNHATHSANFRPGPPCRGRLSLSVASSNGARRLGYLAVGDDGKPPTRQVLPSYHDRAQAVEKRRREVDEADKCSGAGPEFCTGQSLKGGGMSWRQRIRALFNQGKLSADLDEELEFHFAMRKQLNVQDGMSEKEAASAARRQIGNKTQLKEHMREI